MAEVVLVTGGARSGKSVYAESLFDNWRGVKTYIATAEILDAEMSGRVRLHRERRAGRGWLDVEEPLNLPGAIAQAAPGGILVDCLSLWIAKLMFEAERLGAEVDEMEMRRHCAALAGACRKHDGMVVMVISEVGMGIVPENAMARRFRDLSGRCSQEVAGFADRVILVSCGLPLVLKDGGK